MNTTNFRGNYLTISTTGLASSLNVEATRIDPDALLVSTTFRLRRKGVETRIILADAAPEFDRTLISNIVKARNWYADICKGMSVAELARRDGTSVRRIQALIDLTFLSPDILEQISHGTQPIGLTTDYLLKTGFPMGWKEQAEIFATLA